MRRFWLVYVLLFPAFSTTAAQTGTKNAETAGPRYAQDYNWSAKPGEDLSTPGPKSVTLSACPPGVEANEPEYWVYISGTGKAEAVKVTGGTCSGNGSQGTLLFTTTNPHPQGYAIGSASSGLQEASIAARVALTNPTGPRQAGTVVVSPGDLDAYAPVSIRAANQTVDFSGSVINCYVDDSCLVVGDRRNSLNTLDVTFVNPRGRPMVSNGTKPFIEVNAQKTRIFNVATRRTDSRSGTFGTYVQVDDDQAFLLDGLDTSIGGGLRCDATFCGSFVTAPGPFNRWSAVGWLKNMNISANCAGNGVDWLSGNTLHIDDSVIQGYSQFAVRGGTKRGGYGGTSLGNVYTEIGNCSNPKGNVGIAGVIQQGTSLVGSGTGAFPRYANTGKSQVNYYIVAKHSTYGDSVPLLAGYAMTNGSGAIRVTTNDIPGASAGFDLLRVTNNGAYVGPSGTGDFLVAGNVSRGTACVDGVCTFTDPNTGPTSYTVLTAGYFPTLPMWPGDAVLSAPRDTNDPWATAVARIGGFKGSVVSVAGSRRVSVIADVCGAASNWSPLWASCGNTADPPSGNFAQRALLMTTKPNADGGQQLNLKGRINFGTLGSGPGHIITLSDSNFEKTIAQSNGRPANDVNDSYIGYDSTYTSGSNAGISFGAPSSLSHYIGNAGDGKNWKERLTAKEKIFAVPLVVKSGNTFTLGAGSALSQMKIYKTNSIPPTTVPSQSCLDVNGMVSGLNTTDHITGVTPPAPLGNVSLNAYPKAEDTITLHFCNPSASGVSVPPGAYSFLAVR